VWISDVDVPEELLAAARGGTLVVFVGAGASRDAPSSLPDFRQLASSIADEAALPVEPEEPRPPDRLLGRIADAGVDVNQRVRARIDTPGSAPNALHEAIVDLASATRAPRIVTTNYDTHLTSVVRAKGLPWAEYMAPALPMGDDFEGIVYLHGSLRQDPRHLIVTDADFGRAYLRDAWAARFLERMFARFTVLFVGYSHGDVVMRYLARSLGSRSSRFVLTHKPDESDWRQLSIRPVGYQVRASSHVAMAEVIERWARLLSMGLLDHRQRIAQLVAAPPSTVPEETSYLSSVIGDEHTVRLFTDLAGGEAWLTWVAAQPESRQLFDPTAGASACSWALADWFARQWLADEASSNVGLGIVSAAGGHLSGRLWNAVGRELHVRGAPRAPWLQPWVTMLIESVPPGDRDWLEFALVASRLPDDRDAALLLFDYLTEPHIVLKPAFGPGGGARFDVELRGDDYWLRESWAKLLQPGLASIVHDVLAIADRHLRRASQLLTAAGAARQGWLGPHFSFGRSSIAAHPQDRYGDRIGLVIDAARDCLDFLVANDASSAEAVIGGWSASEVSVLRRLAIHGVAIDGSKDGSEKLAWLLNHGFVTDHQLKHEVFELLAAALPSAHDSVVDRVVSEVTSRSSDVDHDDVRAYETFNALVWIARYSTAASARAALVAAQAEHPDFGVREHPDFDMWSEAGFRGSTPPMPAEDFHVLLHRDRTSALDKLAESKGIRLSIEEATWDDAVELVRHVVEEHPEDGFVLLGGDADLDDDLIGATVDGWASQKLAKDVARRAIKRLSALDLDRWGDELARLLGGLGSADRRTGWHRFEGARDLARAIADRLAHQPVDADASNWLERAVNATGGLLAEFWLHAVSYEWNSDRDGWTGMGTKSRGAIDVLLRRGDLHGAFAEVIAASQLHFFFAADREWCRANVLPLLDWDTPERARRAWDGFLFWGRWTDQLLQAGLLGHYLDTVRHVEAFGDDMRRQLAVHLAAVSIYSEIDPGTWAAEFTRASPLPLRVEWLNQVAWTLGRLDGDVRQKQWSRWMRGYWAQRLESIPVRLTFEEASALAGWVVHLEGSFDEAVGLAVASPAGLEQHGQVLLELSNRVDDSPAACARLLAHLLAGTDPPFWHCDQVQGIVTKVRGHATDEDMRQIREQSLRLGCTTAADW
jgi:hypothetical protein